MPRKISTNQKMSFEKFKSTFGPTLDMSESPKKDQFLIAEWKRNMTEIANNEEAFAKQKLAIEDEIRSFEKTLPKGSDEETE